MKAKRAYAYVSCWIIDLKTLKVAAFFFTVKDAKGTVVHNSETAFSNLQPYFTQYVFCDAWTPAKGGTYTVTAELKAGGSLTGERSLAML